DSSPSKRRILICQLIRPLIKGLVAGGIVILDICNKSLVLCSRCHKAQGWFEVKAFNDLPIPTYVARKIVIVFPVKRWRFKPGQWVAIADVSILTVFIFIRNHGYDTIYLPHYLRKA